MKLSGGRRVQRAIYIDVNTVRFLEPEEVRNLADRGLLAPGDSPEEATREVNLRLLRHYLEHNLTTIQK